MKDFDKRLARRVGLIAIVCTLLCLELIGTTAPLRAQGSTLLTDQFTDNSNNWQLAGKSSSTINVANGALTIGVTKENTAAWATPETTVPDDINVQVDMTVPDTSSTLWSGGIIIRADARDLSSAFYQFEVTGDGKWNFVTRTANGDAYKVQRGGSLKEFDATATNTLKVTASGDTFSFLVNGVSVGTFEDSSINNDPSTEKYVGLLISTFQGLKTLKGEFRNLEITANTDGSGNSGSDVTGTDTGPVATAEATIVPTKPGKAPTKVPTKAPTKTGGAPGIKKSPTPTPTANNGGGSDQTSGSPLLQESFDTANTNNWQIGKSTDSRVALSDNALDIQILRKAWIRWSYPDAVNLPGDVDVTVTATAVKPDDTGDWSFGVGVRDQVTSSDEQFYLLEIIGSGNWTFSKVSKNDGFTTIVKTKPLPSDFDPTIDHTIRILAVGSHFSFYLDGTKIGQANDDTIAVGDGNFVVLAAGTYTNSTKFEVRYSNLEVDVP